MTATRPAPVPTELGAPFWAAAREHRLVRPVCDCGHQWFTPTLACPACGSETWRWVQSAGTGAVHSHTVVHRAPAPGFDPPYVVADVDLDEGWHLLTNIVGCPPEDVAIGLRVAVTWLEVADGAVLPVFAPTGEPPR